MRWQSEHAAHRATTCARALCFAPCRAARRRTSFNRIREADEKAWRSTAIECWVASDASAVVEHTKR